MKTLSAFTLGLLLIVALGCSSGQDKANADSNSPTKETASSTPATGTDAASKSPSEPGKNENGEPKTGAEKKIEGVADDSKTKPVSSVPDSLKNDAYDYFGLGNTTPLKLEVASSGPGAQTITGTQSVVLKSVSDGKVLFEVSREGDLARLGTTTLSLETKGIYVESTSGGSINKHSLELPTELKAGKSWKDHTELTQNGKSMKLDNVVTVVGVQKVKTKAGEHQALLITSTGKGTMDGQAITLSSKTWYVKGRGAVKTILTQTPKSGESQVITMQETK